MKAKCYRQKKITNNICIWKKYSDENIYAKNNKINSDIPTKFAIKLGWEYLHQKQQINGDI